VPVGDAAGVVVGEDPGSAVAPDGPGVGTSGDALDVGNGVATPHNPTQVAGAGSTGAHEERNGPDRGPERHAA
jgi:hypothetical protein